MHSKAGVTHTIVSLGFGYVYTRTFRRNLLTPFSATFNLRKLVFSLHIYISFILRDCPVLTVGLRRDAVEGLWRTSPNVCSISSSAFVASICCTCKFVISRNGHSTTLIQEWSWWLEQNLKCGCRHWKLADVYRMSYLPRDLRHITTCDSMRLLEAGSVSKKSSFCKAFPHTVLAIGFTFFWLEDTQFRLNHLLSTVRILQK
jgi:hypothetical protein